MTQCERLDTTSSERIHKVHCSPRFLIYVCTEGNIVTSVLKQSLVPSPPTTLLLPQAALATITNRDIGTALVRRILRHVSPQPWGHISAEAGGSCHALQEIIDTLQKPRLDLHASPTSFTMGAKVWWRPVYLRGNKVGFGVGSREDSNVRLAWLAQRERPLAATRLDKIGVTDVLSKDITHSLRHALLYRETSYSFLYDCRVFVEFNVSACPSALVRAIRDDKTTSVLVLPSTQFYLPQIIQRTPGFPDEVLATFQWPNEPLRMMWAPKTPQHSAFWVHMSSVRSWEPC